MANFCEFWGDKFEVCNNTGGYSHWRPTQPKYWWGCVPDIPTSRWGWRQCYQLKRAVRRVSVKDFFKESLTRGPLRLCVNKKTVRVNDSPYFQFKGHTVPPPIPIKIIKTKIVIGLPHWVTKWVIRSIIYYVRSVTVSASCTGCSGRSWRSGLEKT